MNIFRSATLKLTFWYTLIVMAISLIFSVSLYQLSVRHFQQQVQREAIFFRGMNVPVSFFPQDVDSFRENIIGEFQDRAINELVLFNLIILLLAGTGSYFLARKTLRPIEKSVDAQRQFTADASHELRTPLTAMKTEIEVALRSPALTGENAKKLLHSNLEEIDILTNLSDSLLRLARYEESNGLSFSSTELRSIVADARDRVAAHAEEKKIVIETNHLDEHVIGDRPALVELFMILLDNAVKYSSDNSTVSVWADHAGHSVRIFVRDHGSGIRSVDIPRIFDRFYRADQSRSKLRVHGYGLGLSIAKAIVVRHHGQIDVKSAPDVGSTFSVTLPAGKV